MSMSCAATMQRRQVCQQNGMWATTAAYQQRIQSPRCEMAPLTRAEKARVPSAAPRVSCGVNEQMSRVAATQPDACRRMCCMFSVSGDLRSTCRFCRIPPLLTGVACLVRTSLQQQQPASLDGRKGNGRETSNHGSGDAPR